MCNSVGKNQFVPQNRTPKKRYGAIWGFLGQKWAKTAKMGQNGQNGLKWAKMGQNGPKRAKMGQNRGFLKNA
jgi:hypothetical protein